MRGWVRPGTLMVLCSMLSSCPLPVGQVSSTGDIGGQARYLSLSDNRGIIISAEPVHGVRTAAVAAKDAAHNAAVTVAAQATTNSEGSYRLTSLAAGTYTVTASSPDSLEKAVTTFVNVVAGRGVTASDLHLTPAGKISGTAALNGGTNGNLGILVFVAGTSFWAMTDDTGAFTISSVPAGTGYVLVASKTGYDSSITSVNVSPAATTNVTPMSLPPHTGSVTTGSVTGVATLDGASSGNLGIVVYIAGTSSLAMTDDSGSFTMSGVSPGSYTVVANRTGYISASAPVTVTAGSNSNTGTLPLLTAQVASPAFTPGPGVYAGDQSVTLQSSTSGATIYYTTDLSEPTSSSSIYSAPIAVVGSGTNMTIRAVAVKAGMSASYVTNATYSIAYGQTAAPTFTTVLPGRYSTVQMVSLGCATTGATIRYTSDGSQPTQVNGTTYTAPVAIAAGQTVTIKAYAFKAGLVDSGTLFGTFVVTNPFAYVVNNASGTVSIYTINSSSGALTAAGTVTTAGAAYSAAVDPTGRFFYVSSNGGTVSAYAINPSTGALTSVGTAIPSGTTSYVATVDPTGRFVYVANGGSNDVSAFSINSSTGALTSLGSAIAAGTSPFSIVVEPTGRFVYVANGGGNVSAYSINSSTGTLTSIGAAVAAGTTPRSIAVDPTGRFVYVANQSSSNVSAFAINSSTGALTSIGAVAAGSAPLSIAVDPTGRFAYVANSGAATVSAFTINSATGALTLVSAIGAGTTTYSVTVDATGRFAYATGSASTNVTAYTINPTSGALTSVGAVVTGNGPTFVVTTH